MSRAAVLLFSDYAVASPSETIVIDSAEAWAGAVWRIGARAIRLHADGKTRLTADEALQLGLIDEIASDATTALENRSPLAREAAAMLVRSRGGDALERAEFARLFAIGEPQKGLRAFLQSRKGMSVAEKT